MVNKYDDSGRGRLRNDGARARGASAPCGANVKNMLARLQKTDFYLADIILYLDAYPSCARAKEKYDRLVADREAILTALESAGVPLCATAVKGESWSWGDGPWPWQYDANV